MTSGLVWQVWLCSWNTDWNGRTRSSEGGSDTLRQRVADLAGIGRGMHSDLSSNEEHLNDFGR